MNKDIIRQLPDSVANQIAAGEVIQRPASVIKELVENAIDAKATNIEIALKDAGRTLIQVVDNGTGMSATDARIAFDRHSTSKITCADDLFKLHTMGFRGEALASIAAIAQVELKTQRADDPIGTILQINGNDRSQQPHMYGVGSCFKVKNIFYNVPARRKFLKTNQVELSNILREFERLGLINESVSFIISHNGNILHNLTGGSFKQRITSLFGKTLENQLIPVGVNTSLIKIEGFVSMPEFTRKRNYLQYLFVNGRYMRHPYFHKAILSCYEKLIPQDHQPNYFLKFTVDPGTIDVNIHPTKTEIKFENEQYIWPIIIAAIKESIGKYSTAPTIDFNKTDAIEIPVLTHDTKIIDANCFSSNVYNPFTRTNEINMPSSKKKPDYHASSVENWQSLYDSFLNDKNSDDSTTSNLIHADSDTDSLSTISSSEVSYKQNLIDGFNDVTTSEFLLIKGRYILSQVKSGLMLIDLHRAHLLIIYTDLSRQLSSNGTIPSQRLIFPESIELTSSQNIIMEQSQNMLQLCGFEVSPLGGCTWAIHSAPSGITNVSYAELITEIINSIANSEGQPQHNIKSEIILKIASKTALPYGSTLSQSDMDSLVGKLLTLPTPNYTPHGKAIIKIISTDQLNKLFL